MNLFKLFTGAGRAALLLLLGGCTGTLRFISLSVDNSYLGRGTLCTDGLEASLVLQDARVESGLVAPGEIIDEHLSPPRGASPGTVMTTEASCYQGGEEVGYIRVEKPHNSSDAPIVNILPSPADGELDYPSCVEPTEARGVPICIVSQLYR